MTRATLLHVLNHTSAMGPAEVHELEQLAQAFPYCQTAHLLLAKAAHDHGTMLAGQRLRRAATYAADRTLLRRLIEQVAPVTVIAEEELMAAEVAPAFANNVVAPAAPQPAAPEPMLREETAATAPEAAPAPLVSPAAATAEAVAEPSPAAAAPEEPVTAPVPVAALAAPLPEVEQPPVEDVVSSVPPAAEVEAKTEAAFEAAEAPISEPAADALLLEVEGVEILASEPVPEALPIDNLADIAVEEDLPAQAPAIRPPVEAGEARFEFGLADAPAPVAPAYELPGLVDEWAASAVTRSLGSLEPVPDVLALINAESTPPALTPAAFTGDETIGYGLGESSRLGLSMQLLTLLTDNALAAEAATTAVAVAQPPATPLPPTGAFFEPDLLLLAHWATHCPPAPAVPTSLDLINNFLRRQPRLTRPAMLPPTAGAQADLSVRSTRPETDLVSESLARIFVRQGKTARAIEIYEKLMVKQPEKMAYFAAQIQQLQPPA